MKAKNELLQFVAGLVMLIVGLYIFSQKVMVHSGFFGSGISIGGFHVNSGLILIPMIAGIVWMFVSDAFGAKLLTAVGVLLIVASIIMSTSIHLVSMTLYEWIVILVLIFGGAGFVAKVLFASRGTGNKESRGDRIESGSSEAYTTNYVEEELKKIRDDKK